MSHTLLLIEDDRKLHDLLRDYLEQFGFTLYAEATPEEGLRTLDTLQPDLVILDVMLPGMNGFEVCRRIRQGSDIPVIMLTARGEMTDRVAGLEIGADDYMPKPFEPRELVARIQTVLRRTTRSQPSPAPDSGAYRTAGCTGSTGPMACIGHFGRLVINFDAYSVLLDGEDLSLTTGEFNALALLARNPGRVLDRDALLQALRGLENDAFNRSVDITMSRLRQKLQDDPKAPEFIKTVWGTGYMFIARTTDHD